MESNYFFRLFSKNNFVFFALALAMIPNQNCCFSQELVTDIDGYEYTTVEIGNQTWLKQNLRVTRFNDGTPIELVLEHGWGVWDHDSIPRCSYYNFDLLLERTYGKLYNGYVVRSDKNVCPVGWKIPNDYELTELVLQADPDINTDSLLWDNLSYTAQDKLISDVDAEYGGGGTNETGFSWLLAGAITPGTQYVNFGSINGFSVLWSTTPAYEYEEDRNWTRYISYGNVARYKTHIGVGSPIRCIKDLNYNASAQIDEIKIEFTMYPNPVIDNLYVVVDRSLIGQKYILFDMGGRILDQSEITSEEFEIIMSNFSAGSYILNIGGITKLLRK